MQSEKETRTTEKRIQSPSGAGKSGSRMTTSTRSPIAGFVLVALLQCLTRDGTSRLNRIPSGFCYIEEITDEDYRPLPWELEA